MELDALLELNEVKKAATMEMGSTSNERDWASSFNFVRSTSVQQTKYKVVVCTGDMHNAGTDAKISIVVVGNQGKTQEHKLDKKWVDDFKRKAVDSYTFVDNNVGILEFVIIKMKKAKMEKIVAALSPGDPDWYLEKVIVEKGIQKQVFPHYQWVKYHCDPKMETPLILQTKWTQLPHNATNHGLSLIHI